MQDPIELASNSLCSKRTGNNKTFYDFFMTCFITNDQELEQLVEVEYEVGLFHGLTLVAQRLVFGVISEFGDIGNKIWS